MNHQLVHWFLSRERICSTFCHNFKSTLPIKKKKKEKRKLIGMEAALCLWVFPFISMEKLDETEQRRDPFQSHLKMQCTTWATFVPWTTARTGPQQYIWTKHLCVFGQNISLVTFTQDWVNPISFIVTYACSYRKYWEKCCFKFIIIFVSLYLQDSLFF